MSTTTLRQSSQWRRTVALRLSLGLMLFLSSIGGSAADVRLLETVQQLLGSSLQPAEILSRINESQRETAAMPFSGLGHTALGCETSPRRLAAKEAHPTRVLDPASGATMQWSPFTMAGVFSMGCFLCFHRDPMVRVALPVRRGTASSDALSGARLARKVFAGL